MITTRKDEKKPQLICFVRLYHTQTCILLLLLFLYVKICYERLFLANRLQSS